jgi:hypothetical protein
LRIEPKVEPKVELAVEPIVEPIEESKPEPKVEKKPRKKREVKTPVEPKPVDQEDENEEESSAEEESLAQEESADETDDSEEKAQTSRGRKSTDKGDEDEKSVSTKGFGLKRYKTIENLFLSANTKTVNSRILLAAAFLQEKLGFTEITSYDINSRLKKMGYGVSNITTALYGLFKKNPPWLEYVKKDGEPKQAKKKFTVTEEGIKIAKTYLKGTSE